MGMNPLFFMTLLFTLPMNMHLNSIIIITRNHCFYSESMRKFLRAKNLNFVDLNEDELNADIKAITNEKNFTYPSVYLNGKHIGGYTNGSGYIESILSQSQA